MNDTSTVETLRFGGMPIAKRSGVAVGLSVLSNAVVLGLRLPRTSRQGFHRSIGLPCCC